MAVFTYQPYQSRYTGTLAELAGASLRSQAAAEAAKGEASARMWSGIGNNVAGTLNDLARYQLDKPRREMQQLQLAEVKREAQDEQNIRGAYAQAGGDPAKMRQILTGAPGGISLKADQLLQTLASNKQAHDNEATSRIGMFIHESGNTPEAMQAAFDASEKAGLMTPDDVQRIAGIVNEDPAKIPMFAQAMIGATKEGRDRLEKTLNVKKDETIVSAFDPTHTLIKGAEDPYEGSYTINGQRFTKAGVKIGEPVATQGNRVVESVDKDGNKITMIVPDVAGTSFKAPPAALGTEEDYLKRYAVQIGKTRDDLTGPDVLAGQKLYQASKHIESAGADKLSPQEKEDLVQTALKYPSYYSGLTAAVKVAIGPELAKRGFSGFSTASASQLAAAERWRMTALDRVNNPDRYWAKPADKSAALADVEASYQRQVGDALAGQGAPPPPAVPGAAVSGRGALGASLSNLRPTTPAAPVVAAPPVAPPPAPPAPTAPPPAVSNLLKTEKPGRYTLNDGSVWIKNADGTVTRGS